MDLSQLEERIMPSQGTAEAWTSTMLAMASRDASTKFMPSWPWAPAVADVGGVVLGRLAAPLVHAVNGLLSHLVEVEAAGVRVAVHALDHDLGTGDVLIVPAGAHFQGIELSPQQALFCTSLIHRLLLKITAKCLKLKSRMACHLPEQQAAGHISAKRKRGAAASSLRVEFLENAHGAGDADHDEAQHAGNEIGDGDVLEALLEIQVEELGNDPEAGVVHVVEDHGARADSQNGGNGAQAQNAHHGTHHAGSGHTAGGHGTDCGEHDRTDQEGDQQAGDAGVFDEAGPDR